MSKLVVTAHQATFAPYIGIFRRIKSSNLVDLCGFDYFTMGSDYYIHRVHIGTDTDKRWLQVPLDKAADKYKGRGFRINQVRLSDDSSRWDKFFSELERTYNSSTFYNAVMDNLVFHTSANSLHDFNSKLIESILRYLDLPTPVCSSSLPIGDTTSSRVLYTISQYGSCEYISGNKGKEYINLLEWNSKNIIVKFQSECSYNTLPDHLPYNTTSILGLLFNASKDEVLHYLSEIK